MGTDGVNEMWECEYKDRYKTKTLEQSKYIPPYSRKHMNKRLSKEDICDAATTGELFGMIECDIGVPE